MKNWPIETIPHPIDVFKWKQIDKNLSRNELNLPLNSKLIIFGAISGIKDNRKGFKFLVPALKQLKKITSFKDINLIIFGATKKKNFTDIDYKIHQFSEISDDKILQKLYSAADVMVVPSKIETFGQTATESLACGTPVVAFNDTGLSDIIEHKKSGYLAKYLNEIDLANGISWVLENSYKNNLSINSRKRAENYFSEEVIIKKYLDMYNRRLLGK